VVLVVIVDGPVSDLGDPDGSGKEVFYRFAVHHLTRIVHVKGRRGDLRVDGDRRAFRELQNGHRLLYPSPLPVVFEQDRHGSGLVLVLDLLGHVVTRPGKGPPAAS